MPDARVVAWQNERTAGRQARDKRGNERRDERRRKRRETGETEIMQETGETLSDDEIRDALTVKLETPGASLSGIAAEIGVNKGVLHKFLRNGETPSDTTRACCMAFLRHETAICEA